MLAALALPILLAQRHQRLTRRSGVVLLAAYPAFILVAMIA
jgi:hypothetical protein